MADQPTPRRSRARTPTLEQPAASNPEPVVQAPAAQEPAAPGPSAPELASAQPAPSEPAAAPTAPQEDARPARTLSVRSPRVREPRAQDSREREGRPQEARSQDARPQEGRPQEARAQEGRSQEGATVRKEAGSLRINELRNLNADELASRAEKLGIENAQTTRRGRLTQKIIERELEKGSAIFASGVFEASGNGEFGFLRDPLANFAPGDDDIYVPAAMIRRNNLRTGDEIEIEVRPKGEQQQGGHHGKGAKREDRLAAGRLVSLHGKPPEASRNIPQFEDLTPLHPNRMMRLERPIKAEENITGRLVDLISPIGFGQRALLVAPPKSGKTVMMQHVAHAISSNHPDVHLIVLLVDERPEEVTEMIRSVKGEVFASTFDQPAASHVELAEMVIERAKRLVERKKDVVILLDSITRLARAYNTTAPSSGKILSGGVEANALTRPKRFFGAARNIEEGGSLTIVATALTDTGSRMDEVIYEEFKGTGNMEIHLERRMMEKRVYPAININRSGTRREELLLDASDLPKIWVLRKLLHGMDELAALEFMLDKLRDSKNNGDFMDAMRRG